MRRFRRVLGAALSAAGLFGAWTAGTGFAADAVTSGTDNQGRRIERVVVLGQRLGNLRNLLADHTLRGTEGFIDGSAPEESDNRSANPWEVYYNPNGTLEARFRRAGARVPHGTMEDLDYSETGTWTINDDNEICQSIPKVGSGFMVCMELRKTGPKSVQMYYTQCGAMNRCYPGRLGPEGDLFPGRSFTR